MSQTQRQKVLELLNQAEGVCGTVFQNQYIPEYRSRINELKKEGYNIIGVRCTQHKHIGGMMEWKLLTKAPESKQEPPTQDFSPKTTQTTTRTGYAYQKPVKTFIEAFEEERKRKGAPLTKAEMNLLAKKYK